MKSLAKGMRLLEAFSPRRPRLTLTELAGVTGMNLATVQRLTHTLVTLDYLGRDRHKRFFLSPRVLALGQAFSGGSDLRRMAEPLLEGFSRHQGCTVNLSVLEGHEVVIIYRHEVERFFKFDLQEGSRLPAYCTSMGKLMLAALPERELNALVGSLKLERLTTHTITDRKALKENLAAIRRVCLAESDREASLALHSLAAPVLDSKSRVVAAISASLPVGVEELNQEKVSAELVNQGRHLSSLMGYKGPYPALGPEPGTLH
ncbi:MAG: helix-turn-helix domain-containing protein [Desulfarculaceae bacterium]|nr:helix-turn-helix domain-containing protein [Desulfarculaceae bacterium]MCF8071243.1 helix-turn-helix domain-containing protein [Desulfarculaceae bacterium]MCF8101154.1 helix-turn-helix domain-containing protein [Desulfarculaceae bacterium]MCF8115297.1 helix-turn-helix domain-containing protein [Desulfarculaceae bacterium]